MLQMQLPINGPDILLVVGAVFVLIAVVGGGFEVSALRIPPIGKSQRVFALLAGVVLITLGVRPAKPEPTPVGPSTTTTLSTTPVAPAPAPEVTPETGQDGAKRAKPAAKPAAKPPPNTTTSPPQEPPPPPVRPPLSLKFFHATGRMAPHPEVRVTVPAGYKVISGGARVNYQEPGNLLTASYPEGTSAWVARSKDHELASPAQIEAWAVALYDPGNGWEVHIAEATSTSAPHPTTSVTLPEGYTMTGGGARANWEHGGSLLTASYPNGTRTWEARSKDHRVSDPATLTVYVIGIRPLNGAASPASAQFEARSDKESHPHATVRVGADYVFVGGGAKVNWEGSGNLLTASYPDDQGGWTAASKDHIESDPAVIVAYALGVAK